MRNSLVESRASRMVTEALASPSGMSIYLNAEELQAIEQAYKGIIPEKQGLKIVMDKINPPMERLPQASPDDQDHSPEGADDSSENSLGGSDLTKKIGSRY